MSEVLPLIFIPAIVGMWLSDRKRRSTRPALRDAIAARRKPMLMDAGSVSVLDVARSLEVSPGCAPARCPLWFVGARRRAWEVSAIVAPLGLQLTEAMRERRGRRGHPGGFEGTSRFSGLRHGRHADVELRADDLSVVLTLPVVLAAFRLTADAAGKLAADAAVPASLGAALEVLAPSRHWRGVTVTVEGQRITLERRVDGPASWMHALWLAEFVADLAAPPQDTSVPPLASETSDALTVPALALGA